MVPFKTVSLPIFYFYVYYITGIQEYKDNILHFQLKKVKTKPIVPPTSELSMAKTERLSDQTGP